MKSGINTLMCFLAVCAALAVPLRLGAQNAQDDGGQARYQVTTLDSLGGTASGAISVNNRGWTSGLSNLTGDQAAHAALWLRSSTVDLGTLGGTNSAVNWPVKDDRGVVVGISETDQVDPLGERWSCRFGTPPTGHSCVGFLWQDNLLNPLPTLGGNNGYASAANNRGEIVGWAENTVHDPTCNGSQVLQFEAVRWTPRKNKIDVLPPLPGDPDGAATAINDRGQVVGISGICDVAYGGASAAHAVLWDDGVPTDLGNFGGALFNTPAAINNRGQITGWSDLPGDQAFHAFLWTKQGGLQDLGTLPGDTYSLAYGINDEGQVVGQSLDANFNSRAFLWENGKMIDLNSRTLPGSPYLIYANDINDAGEIVGGGCDQCAGEAIAFKAFPRRGHEAGQGSASHRKVVLTEKLRNQLRQRRLFGRMDMGR